MKQRGRKSSAALSVISPAGIETIRRPEPPAELTGPQTETWRRIVGAHASDWFTPGAQPVLVQLCRHVDAAAKLACCIRELEEGDEFDVDRWQGLLRAQGAESARIAALATRLRLTPQSRYTPATAARRAGGDGPKPWEAT